MAMVIFASQYPKYNAKTMLRKLVGEHGLASNPASHINQLHKSKLCKMCNIYAVDDVPFLFVHVQHVCEASHTR